MSRIRILYDEWGFGEPHGGVSRLFTEIMKNLPDDFEWILAQSSTVNEYLKLPPFNLPQAKLTFKDFVEHTLCGHCFPGAFRLYKLVATLFPQKFPAYEIQSRARRMAMLKTGDYDIYHVTAAHWKSDDWKIVAGKKPIVVTVHDLIPEIVDHDGEMMSIRGALLEAASHIIAVSENTKRDIQRLYSIPSDKITVIYHGANMKKGENAGERPNDITGVDELDGGRFVLFVGKRDGYKNFAWMVRTLVPLMKDGLKLFCTGVPFSTNERCLFNELGIEHQITQKFVSDAEMQWLFEHAVCFIHPSLYEGFGIPILDAFAAGCPAVLAKTSCFPEVADDAALYFDPMGDGNDLRGLVMRLSDDLTSLRGNGLRMQMVGKGLERIRFFSWEKSAIMTSGVYRSVLLNDCR